MTKFFSWKADKLLEKLFNQSRYEDKNSELKEKILMIRNELKSKKTAQTRIYNLMDDPELDSDELRERLLKNQEQRLYIRARHSEAEKELEQSERTFTNQQMLVSFFNNNKNQLKELAKDIQRISTEDKKRMVEAMLDGPIIVDYRDPDPDNPDDGSGPDLTIPWKFNPEILEKFSDEGKLRLDKDSTNYSSFFM